MSIIPHRNAKNFKQDDAVSWEASNLHCDARVMLLAVLLWLVHYLSL